MSALVNSRLSRLIYTYLAVGLTLMACASCSTGMVAMLSTARDAMRSAGKSNPRLNPSFRYLRVAIQGRVVFLALGNEDPHELGTIEVWYSANREVLRLQNGRIAGAVGLTTEWRSVVLNEAPPWLEAVRDSQPRRWVRTRDVMPGYRYGMRDQLELRSTPAPQNLALQGIESQRLSWFEERTLSRRNEASATVVADSILPAARYAVEVQGDRATVIYGEQCLAPELCFTWQRWKP